MSALASNLFFCAQFPDPRFIYSVDHYELEYVLVGKYFVNYFLFWIYLLLQDTVLLETVCSVRKFVFTQTSHTKFCPVWVLPLALSTQSGLEGFSKGGQ